MTTVQSALRILVAAAILMVPCVVSGRPQLFSDTRSYYLLGQEIATVAGMGPAVPVAAEPPSRAVASAGAGGRGSLGHGAAATAKDPRLAFTVAGSRSPYYSALLFALVRLGTAWLAVAVQCLVTAAVMAIALKAFALDRALPAIAAVLALTSSLAIFAMFVMPDFMMAPGVLALAVLAARWGRLGAGERLVLAAALAAAALFHGANAIVLGLVSALGLAASLVGPARLAPARRGLALGAATAAAAFAALLAYPAAVKAVRHEPIYSPPFLAARLIADGPGRDYLRTRCGHGADTDWCRFAGRPLTDNNAILWNTHSDGGAFQLAGYDLRVRLIEQQPRFVLAVIGYAPLAVARAAVLNAAHLLVNYRVQEVMTEDNSVWSDPRFRLFTAFVPGTLDCAARASLCAPRLDYRLLNPLIGAVAAAALVAIAALLAGVPTLRERWGIVVGVIAATLVVNAIVYGIVSGNAERYQSRLIWLLPFLALAMAYDWWRTAGDRGR